MDSDMYSTHHALMTMIDNFTKSHNPGNMAAGVFN